MENQIHDIAATSDQKWLFAACGKGWWAILDLQQEKGVSRQDCTPDEDGDLPRPTSVAVSPDDQLFYMVTNHGTVESFDIYAAQASQMKSIPDECFVNVTVDPANQFLFIACRSRNLYKYDTG